MNRLIGDWTSLLFFLCECYLFRDWLIFAILDASAAVALFLAFLTVSPMEHKRDATVAGLSWPSNPTRGLAPTNPVQVSDAQTSALSHSGPPDTTTSPTSAPLVNDGTAPDTGTMAHSDTYSGPAPPGVPFPTESSSTHNYLHRAQFSSRVVHQIQFKVITHSNNTRELFIEEIPLLGHSRCRDPEHYFYGLSGNWEWSLRTADYWRHHFEIPLVHGHHPFHNVPIETTSPGDEPSLTTRIHELAKDLSDTLKAATASGEFDQTWAMVERMSFHDAMEVLLQAPNSSSD